jgi:predicted DNA-binding WGR domain protein
MQIIRNTNRDVYILYTRWGRIGEDGMHQKIPLADKLEAETEFKKIFKSKSGNE